MTNRATPCTITGIRTDPEAVSLQPRPDNRLRYWLTASIALHVVLISGWQVQTLEPYAVPGTRGIAIELVQTANHADAIPANPQPLQPEPDVASGSHKQKQDVPVETPAHTAQNHTTTTASQPATEPATKGAASERNNHILNDVLHADLQRALQPHFTYPLLARRKGWQGTVRVGLRVEANGEISHLHIVTPSHYPRLDEAALASLRQVKQLPAAVKWLAGYSFDLILPVEYRLL